MARGAHCRSAGKNDAPASVAGQLGLHRAHLVEVEQAALRRPAARRRSTRAGSPAHVCLARWTTSAPLRRMRAGSPSSSSSSSKTREAGERELELGAGVLVGAQDVALPQPGRGARHLAAVEQRDVDPAGVQLPRGGGADDAGADDRDLAWLHRAKPAGKGSRSSSRYWPMPVIHARPVISGTTAGRAADLDLLDEPAGEARADDRLVDERPRPAPSSPRACSCAMRAHVPVPHGERSSQPGWIEVALRASAPSRPGAWKTTWWQPRDALVDRVHRARGTASRIARARLDQLAGARRVDLEPDGGGVDERVEVAAEGHVVGAPSPTPSTTATWSRACRKAGTLRSVTASARPPDTATRASTRPGGRVEAHDRLGLAHLDHAGLDEHGGHADRAVAAHRQAAGDLDEEDAPVGVVARRAAAGSPPTSPRARAARA